VLFNSYLGRQKYAGTTYLQLFQGQNLLISGPKVDFRQYKSDYYPFFQLGQTSFRPGLVKSLRYWLVN